MKQEKVKVTLLHKQDSNPKKPQKSWKDLNLILNGMGFISAQGESQVSLSVLWKVFCMGEQWYGETKGNVVALFWHLL